MQIQASDRLSGIVKHFLVLETTEKQAALHRFFPDGNTGMVFHYGDPFLSHPASYVYGQASGFQQMISDGTLGMLIVVFQPYGIHTLLKIPAHELTDQIISLKEFWGSTVHSIAEQIYAATDTLSRIRLIEQWLTDQIETDAPGDLLVKHAIQLIGQHKGLAPVQTLANLLYTHERQLERKFREHIGVSPKYFSGVVKLQHALKLLQRKTPQQSLTDIVYECGYYDQAHFIRELKKATGLTPRQYLFKTHALALNLVKLPTAE